MIFRGQNYSSKIAVGGLGQNIAPPPIGRNEGSWQIHIFGDKFTRTPFRPVKFYLKSCFNFLKLTFLAALSSSIDDNVGRSVGL